MGRRSHLKLYKPRWSSQFPVRQRRDLRVDHCTANLSPAKMSRLVILSQLLCLLMIPGNIGGRVAQFDNMGFVAFPDIGVAYKYFDSKRTWDAARETCLQYNGTLAVIDSWKKIDYAQSIRTKDQYNVATGIQRGSRSGRWVSVRTGLPVTAKLPWAPGTYPEHPDENECLVFDADGSGLHADLKNRLRSFVCEVTLSPSYIA